MTIIEAQVNQAISRCKENPKKWIIAKETLDELCASEFMYPRKLEQKFEDCEGYREPFDVIKERVEKYGYFFQERIYRGITYRLARNG